MVSHILPPSPIPPPSLPPSPPPSLLPSPSSLPPSLPPSAQRGGSWVVDRVVGPADLKAPDGYLRRRLQLTSHITTGTFTYTCTYSLPSPLFNNSIHGRMSLVRGVQPPLLGIRVLVIIYNMLFSMYILVCAHVQYIGTPPCIVSHILPPSLPPFYPPFLPPSLHPPSLPLPQLREGGHGDRVVGPADLMAPDDSLREHMRRLQFIPPTPTGTFTCTCHNVDRCYIIGMARMPASRNTF